MTNGQTLTNQDVADLVQAKLSAHDPATNKQARISLSRLFAKPESAQTIPELWAVVIQDAQSLCDAAGCTDQSKMITAIEQAGYSGPLAYRLATEALKQPEFA